MMQDSILKRKLIGVYEFLYKKHRYLFLRMSYHINIMKSEQTIEYIKTHHISCARYGDGELGMMLGKHDIGFQKWSAELAEDLKSIMKEDNDRLLVCIPRTLITLLGLNKHAKDFWYEWGAYKQKEILDFLNHSKKGYCFGDAQFTRPYIDWRSKKHARRIFKMLSQLWANKNVLIVEGNDTRLGVGNDLFCDVNSVQRILAPSEGAYYFRYEIVEAVMRHYTGQLILLALGPTATVLASDFSRKGIQALDVGHIDIEYEWFIRGTKSKIAISGKYVNEAGKAGRVSTECKDEKYLSQIIEKIGY